MGLRAGDARGCGRTDEGLLGPRSRIEEGAASCEGAHVVDLNTTREFVRQKYSSSLGWPESGSVLMPVQRLSRGQR